MFWVPTTFKDWVWMFWKMLTDPPPAAPAILATVPKRCPYCGRA